MPGFDGSGPLGQGSKTGRALGNCDGANQNVQGNIPLGRGLGLGRGNRGGRRALGRGRGIMANNISQPDANNENDQILLDENKRLEEKVNKLEEKLRILEEKHGL
ncbi:MAG: hypothetical protein C0601_12635 [Candidatus Muiribacterium halophilum]|uniref:Cytoplasmic protein n=1 Tax=Muiribacterium halophilum TaxID=2053465 RepID=A0A2N5ZA31_MUIH1|nr:MAG: hypothetical protein C0601_12635 [Candidatus Muirbacterium halophilum]